MSVLRRLGLIGVVRSSAEVAAEAREEIEFHLESRVRDLVQAGDDEESARRAAAESFGDVEKVVRQCVRARSGELVIMQRILVGLVVLLSVGIAAMVWQNVSLHAQARDTEHALEQAFALLAERERAAASRAESVSSSADAVEEQDRTLAPPPNVTRTEVASLLDASSWRERFAERPLDKKHASALAWRLAKLPSEDGMRLLEELWPGLSTVARREALAAFAKADHEHLLDVLDLGANDPRTRDDAFELLRGVALQDFRDDPAAYAAWRARSKGLPRQEVLARSAGPLVLRLQGMSAADGLALFGALELDSALRGDEDLVRVLRGAGALALAAAWLGDGASPQAFAIANALGADDAWLRLHVLPFASDPAVKADTRAAACAAIGRPGASWAVPVIGGFARGYLQGLAPSSVEVGSADRRLIDVMRGLVRVGDPSVIPAMIAMIRDDQSGAAIYNVGHFGLAKLTGVGFDAAHDGEWWVQWWHDNQQHLPAAIRGMPLPN